MTEIDVLKRAREVVLVFPHPESVYYRTASGAIVYATHKGKKRPDIVSLLRSVTTDQKLIDGAITRLQSALGKVDMRSWTISDVARALESAAQVAGGA